MSDIRVESVWEGDHQWQDDKPRFRVWFQEGTATETGGWTTVYDITGADVVQVIDWAQRHATGTITWALALVIDSQQTARDPEPCRGVIWLAGADGNARYFEVEAAQQRMLQRRDHPIQIPASGRLPDEYNIDLPFTGTDPS